MQFCLNKQHVNVRQMGKKRDFLLKVLMAMTIEQSNEI